MHLTTRVDNDVLSKILAKSQFKPYPFRTALLNRADMLLRVTLDPIRNERLIRVTVPDTSTFYRHCAKKQTKTPSHDLRKLRPANELKIEITFNFSYNQFVHCE